MTKWLKQGIWIGTLGIALGGAGLGEAQGAVPLSSSDYEKLPVYLRTDQAKRDVKERYALLTKKNSIEKLRSRELAGIQKELKKDLGQAKQERKVTQDQLEQLKLKSEITLAQAAQEAAVKETTPKAVVEPNGEVRYKDPLEPKLLMKEGNTPESESKENQSNETPIPRKKPRPANAWKIVLAQATVPLSSTELPQVQQMEYDENGFIIRQEESKPQAPAQDPQEKLKRLEEIFRNQQNLIQMANSSFDSHARARGSQPLFSSEAFQLASHWQAGNEISLTPAQKPSENHGIQSFAGHQTQLSKRSYEEESDDREFLRLGSHLSRVREL